ncbi:MAG: hypothetical protein K2X51_12635 [Burkholderiales bacterium]|nr:hypothetical protein [Burkholderiales bacterium]
MTQIYIQSPRQNGKAHARRATVIAFTGAPGAGKDSAAAVLVNHRAFITIAFADALRREITAAWRIDERMLTHRPTKETPIPALAVGMCGDPAFVSWAFSGGDGLHAPRSPRWVMQQWGTFQRRYAPTHYADIVARWVGRQLGTGHTRIAVTDLRYPWEESALRAIGADLHIVRVHRHETTHLADDTAQHSSERYRLRADSDVVNDASLQALAEAVLELPPVAALTAAPIPFHASEGGAQ